jgi:hypothetical protein
MILCQTLTRTNTMGKLIVKHRQVSPYQVNTYRYSGKKLQLLNT